MGPFSRGAKKTFASKETELVSVDSIPKKVHVYTADHGKRLMTIPAVSKIEIEQVQKQE